jgi:hypothetical protein
MSVYKRVIRKLIILLPFLLWGVSSYAQDDAIGKFFGKYMDDDRFSVVSISPKMFRLLTKVNWDTVSPDMKQTISKIQSLRILSTNATPRQFYKEAIAKLNLNDYEELITVRSKGDNVHFMIKENGNLIHELLMISVDDDGFTLMSFVGDIDLDKMARLSSDLSIKGMENLKDVKRKN